MQPSKEILRQDIINLMGFEERRDNRTLEIPIEHMTPGDVIDHYYSTDSLNEYSEFSLWHVYETHSAKSFEKILLTHDREFKTNETSAMCLVAHILLDNEPRDDSRNWAERTHDLVMQKSPGSEMLHPDILAPEDVIIMFLKTVDEREYSPEDLKHMFVAAEMLLDASTAKESRVMLGAASEEETDKDIMRRQLDRTMAKELLLATFKQSRMHAADDPDVKVMQLQAACQLLAMQIADDYYPEGKEENKIARNATLISIMQLLKNNFTGPEKMQDKHNYMKGVMHEMVWMLDAMMLREVTNLDYRVFPSVSRQDQPRLGYPKANRGFDYMLSGDKGELAVQLKSSRKGKAKPYHPKVMVLCEQNFMDVDERRLQAKIKAYEQVVAADFSDESWGAAEKYILPSVKEAIEAYAALQPFKFHELIGQIAARYGAPVQPYQNRAARRQAARKKRR